MNRPPEPPPEGVLIETARKATRLSVREAARHAGISEGWWRQVVKGYQSLSGGAHGIVRAPAGTVAEMARVVGLTPQQMETEGQRPDAAEAMRRDAEARVPRPAPVTADDIFREARDEEVSGLPEDMRSRIEEHLEDIAILIAGALTQNPGSAPIPSGAEVFGAGTFEGGRWDMLIELGREQLPPGGFDRKRLVQIAALARYRDTQRRQGHGAAAAGRLARTRVFLISNYPALACADVLQRTASTVVNPVRATRLVGLGGRIRCNDGQRSS